MATYSDTNMFLIQGVRDPVLLRVIQILLLVRTHILSISTYVTQLHWHSGDIILDIKTSESD